MVGGLFFHFSIHPCFQTQMTYLYETIPAQAGDEVKRYEIKQSIHDDALTVHPETGERIRRIISGGMGLITSKSSGGGGGHSHSGGGCGACGCH